MPYWKLCERKIVCHYEAIADAIDLPVMAYSNLITKGIGFSPALIVRMAKKVTNITMVKEGTRDIGLMLLQTDGKRSFT